MTKHALLIGVADEHPEQVFHPGPSLAAMRALLADLGDWTSVELNGLEADREGILAALAQVEARLEPNDTLLFYFVGHGGVVEIRDLPAPLGARHVSYLSSAREGSEWHFEGILDIELSASLSRAQTRCGNVSVILDCCYSGRVVRGPVWVVNESPAWLRLLSDSLPRLMDTPECGTGHPDIVRLSASTMYRMSFSSRQDNAHLGRLTQLFVSTLREAKLALDRLSWDTVAHRLRERAIWELRCEEQWVNLAGPKQRLVFSTDSVSLPRTVGFVPHEHEDGGWLRAGALQGVELGDEWGLAELTLDDELRPRWHSLMRVAELGLNRARLEWVDGAPSPEIGTAAHLLRARRPGLVNFEGSCEALRAAAITSPWLALPTDEREPPLATVRARDGRLTLTSADSRCSPSRFCADSSGSAAALALLEDWVRTRALLRVVKNHSAPEQEPLRARLGLLRDEKLRWSGAGEAIARPGDRLVVELQRGFERGEWFVSVILIDVAGRPRLLDPSEPDGRELLGGQREIIGHDPHGRHRGIVLGWPPQALERDAVGELRVVVLASQRPLQLAHLCRSAEPEPLIPLRESAPAPRRVQRGFLAAPRPRTGPELTRASAALLLSLQLEPALDETY